MNLILASASPRRADILRQLGFVFTVRPVDVDEALHGAELPESYLARVVKQKMQTACLQGARSLATEIVLVADTIVVSQNRVLGKPVNAADHLSSLAALRASSHTVMTRFALRDGLVGYAQTVCTTVHIATFSDAEAHAYVDSGEGSDKAGGYAIQGAFARYVEGIVGSYTNVVGLPAREVSLALAALQPGP